MVKINGTTQSVTSKAYAARLASVVKGFYQRGWALGAYGCSSVVVGREPLRLAITPAGIDRGLLRSDDILEIDCTNVRRIPNGKGDTYPPETDVHVGILNATGASAVLQTQSVWNTLLSAKCVSFGGVSISDHDMLSGLSGVSSRDHQEWVPIIDVPDRRDDLLDQLDRLLRHGGPTLHGVMLSGQGLYTWGADLAEAKRHVEILEFLLEVVGRAYFTVGKSYVSHDDRLFSWKDTPLHVAPRREGKALA